MELVDTHCHIQSAGASASAGEKSTRQLWAKAPNLTADEMIATAAQASVNKLICVGCDQADSRLAIEFVKIRENCFASVGIHPHEAQNYADKTGLLEKFARLASEPKVVAIGECGLDYFYEHSPRDAQIEILKFQIELALERDLPMIFHVREAFDDFWPVFESYKNICGVLHSFTDSHANLEKALKHNLLIGVNGIATFAKNPDQLAVYKAIPLENLLLETDAPFLTPAPFRGKINEPKHIRVTAEFLASLRNESLAKLAEQTTANARRLFGI